MKPITPYFKAVLAAAILVVCVIAQAAGGSGLISAEASEVVRANPGKSSDARGRQLAILQSYLFTQPVTVGLDPDAASDPQAESIVRGVKIWSDALPDCWCSRRSSAGDTTMPSITPAPAISSAVASETS